MERDSTIFPKCASRANFSVRVCLFTSHMANSTAPFVACSRTGPSRKTNKVEVLRATIDGSPSLCNISLRCPSRRNRDTNHDVAHSLRPFSRRQVAGYVPMFTPFATRMITLFCATSSSSSSSSSCVPSSPGPPDQTPVSHVFHRFHLLPSRTTPSSMLGMSRHNMVFNLQLGRSTSDRNNIGLLNLNRFIIYACIHHPIFDRHAFHFSRSARYRTKLQLRHWRLCRLTHVRHGTYLFRGCRRPLRLLFCTHWTQFLIASCAHVLLHLGVSDVGALLKIQTYYTRFIDNLILNELLNLSRNRAVVWDDVAYIRIYNCNKALTVNFSRADQSFVDVCLPALESHSIPTLSLSVHVLQKPCTCVSVPIFASSVNAEIARPVSYVHLNQPSESKCSDPPRFSHCAKSRELAKAACACCSTAAAWSHCCSKESAPFCLCSSSVFLCLLCFGFHQSQSDSLDSTNTPCSSGLSCHNAHKQRPCLDSDYDSGLHFCLLSCHHLSFFLPFLPPLPKLSTSIGSEVLCAAAVLSAGWLRRASVWAWISLRTCSSVISRARFMGKYCSNSLGTRNSSTAVLMSLSRAPVVVPLDWLLSYRLTSASHFSSLVGGSCCLHRSGARICRRSALHFPPLRGAQRRTKRRRASRPDGATPRTMSNSFFVKARSATWTCSLFSWTSSTGSGLSGPNCWSSASFVAILS